MGNYRFIWEEQKKLVVTMLERGQTPANIENATGIKVHTASGKTQIDFLAPLILNKTECSTMVQKWNINVQNGANGANGS